MVEKIVIRNDQWDDVKEAARMTVGKKGVGKTPTDSWKKQILLAEHSPIRLYQCKIIFKDIPFFVSGHFVRHKVGSEHFVKTERDDRSETHAKRSDLPQDAPVDYMMVDNAQALINISRKRLCNQASKETKEEWKSAVNLISQADPVLGSVLVPECIYRGFCPESNCCGYVNTEEYKKRLKEYRKVDK